MATEEDRARESQLLVTAIDPLARQILDAVEPWDAYDVANGIPGALLNPERPSRCGWSGRSR